MYVRKQKLVSLLADLKAKGEPSRELLTVLEKIITGLAYRYKFVVDIEDAVQEYHILVYRKRNNIDLSQNLFNYLTTLAMNLLKVLWRTKKAKDMRCLGDGLEYALEPKPKRKPKPRTL